MDDKQSNSNQPQANAGTGSDFQKAFRDRPGMKILFYVSIGIILLGIGICLLVGLGWLAPNR